MVKRERHVVNVKVPQHTRFSFLVCFIKDLGFRRIILECDNELSTKALQDAVIMACAGVEVIPQGPSEGDHMAKDRVEIPVRERNDNAELSEFPLNMTQVCVSQMTVRYSVGFFVLQRKS